MQTSYQPVIKVTPDVPYNPGFPTRAYEFGTSPYMGQFEVNIMNAIILSFNIIFRSLVSQCSITIKCPISCVVNMLISVVKCSIGEGPVRVVKSTNHPHMVQCTSYFIIRITQYILQERFSVVVHSTQSII